mgnify:CR=1 FL=1|jgi:hypothetical protein
MAKKKFNIAEFDPQSPQTDDDTWDEFFEHIEEEDNNYMADIDDTEL